MYRVKDLNGNIKLAGRSKAKVLDNRDPFNRGYIIVDHPSTGPTTWIPYLKTPSFFDVPSIGDIVYVEADSGEGQYPIAWGNLSKGIKDQNDVPQAFKRDVPTNRGIFTPGGHLIEFDDGEAKVTQEPDDKQYTTKNKGIRVTSSAGNKIHIIEDEDNGNQYILIEDVGGNLIKLDYKNNELTINSIGNTNFNTAGDKTDTVEGKLTINVKADAVINTDANATINAKGNVDVTAKGNATISSDGQAQFKGKGGTTVGDSAAPTNVDGAQVLLAGGGPGVARLGDRAFGIGNLGIPVSSTIIQGSPKVLSG